jgi:hypothetical protein
MSAEGAPRARLGLAESGTAARWSKEHLIAFVEIAFISILSRRLKRLVVKELSARRLQTDTYSRVNFAVIPATWRPWKRASSSSFALGLRDPSAFASVVAP